MIITDFKFEPKKTFFQSRTLSKMTAKLNVVLEYLVTTLVAVSSCVRSTLSLPLQKTTPHTSILNIVTEQHVQHEDEHLSTWAICLLMAMFVAILVFFGFGHLHESYKANKTMRKKCLATGANYIKIDHGAIEGTQV